MRMYCAVRALRASVVCSCIMRGSRRTACLRSYVHTRAPCTICRQSPEGEDRHAGAFPRVNAVRAVHTQGDEGRAVQGFHSCQREGAEARGEGLQDNGGRQRDVLPRPLGCMCASTAAGRENSSSPRKVRQLCTCVLASSHLSAFSLRGVVTRRLACRYVSLAPARFLFLVDCTEFVHVISQEDLIRVDSHMEALAWRSQTPHRIRVGLGAAEADTSARTDAHTLFPSRAHTHAFASVCSRKPSRRWRTHAVT